MLPIPILDLDDIIRFWGFVNRGGNCWLWIGDMNCAESSQPRFYVQGILYTASRLSWRIHFNENPEELLVCHTCDNPLCMKPNHLWLGTASDNQQDSHDKGQKLSNARKIEDWDVPIIRKLHASGISQREIAKRYRVHHATINRIVIGKRYSEL